MENWMLCLNKALIRLCKITSSCKHHKTMASKIMVILLAYQKMPGGQNPKALLMSCLRKRLSDH